jgi:fatty acid desaturase
MDTTAAAAGTRNANAARVRAINQAILADEKRLRAAWPVLRHQDAIGLGIWLGSLTLWLVGAWAWFDGRLPTWLAVPLLALPLSLLHELEHDLIHDLYCKARPWLQDVMLGGIWLAKGSLNPWTRRSLHLYHHHHSGQTHDVEERLIGLGHASIPLRLFVALMPPAAGLMMPAIRKDVPGWRLLTSKKVQDGPGIEIRGPVHRVARWLDLLMFAAPLVVLMAAMAGSAWGLALFAVWTGPNQLRHACIVLMSSYSHYYGDIPARDVFYQNQVLRHWALLPFQVFCCDFGATHIIHHYVVQQPFYVRHLVRKAAWAAMEAQGTRVDDWGVVARANRFGVRY